MGGTQAERDEIERRRQRSRSFPTNPSWPAARTRLADAYTIVAPTQVTQVSAIRLEALTHESLPIRGQVVPNRPRQLRSMVNFTITAHIPGTQPRPIEVSRVAADHHFLGTDGKPDWNHRGRPRAFARPGSIWPSGQSTAKTAPAGSCQMELLPQ